jgi:NAD(P) transhydrogenase subunit alpha
LIIAVLKETAAHEQRVALSPEVTAQLISKNLEIWIEKDAGLASNFLDKSYIDSGAKVASSKDELLSNADILLSVQIPSDEDLKKLKKGTVLISFIWALQHPELVALLKELGITALGMDAIPRISRAQNMDALSSMSSIAGYKASLIAANELDKYFPMMMTAAGTIPPSKALILGAGVAGLQAIATCRKLGAVVEAFDVRAAVKEQVESLGAKFIEVELSDEETETKGGYAKELTEDDKLKQRELIHNG